MKESPIVARRSKIQGRGVFATRAIPEGERIGPDEADAGSPDDSKVRRHHTFFFMVDDDVVIDGSEGGNDSRFINHSCDPNCEVVITRRCVYIHAIRDIAPGDALSHAY